jgi:hypothetical protein
VTHRTHTGGCLCGAIRFEIVGEPYASASCHCTICQRAGGSAFLPFAAYETGQVRFTRGELQTYRSSAEALRGFCGVCGSPVSFAYDAEPGHIWMTLGCFDDRSALRPAEDWHVGVKMPWLTLDDEIRHWPGAPGRVSDVTGRPPE